MSHRIRGIVILSITWLMAALPVSAQQSPSGDNGGISGIVLDSETSLPLQGAIVSLDPQGTAAFPGARGEAFVTAGRAAMSDGAGSYSFERLPPGRYRIRFSRIGYRTAAVAVELRGAVSSRVSVGLTVEPVLLEPLVVEAAAATDRYAYARTAPVGEEIEGSRVDAARARQRRHLASDARAITHADVLESVTLGETDLFRALQRAPGVGARDDYGADFWVRGASWDQTRVYFDGVPLFNPVHGFGLLSAVNTDAIGGALLQPGVRSAAIGEGAAAVLNVTSRAGSVRDGVRGLGDLSLASGRLALDGGTADGGVAWMIAGRRSWVDAAAAMAAYMARDPTIRMPYSFSDLTGRVDLDLGEGRALEASGMREYDRISGTLPDIFHRTRAAWGNTAARVTFAAPRGELQTRTTLGFSRFGAAVREANPDPEGEGGYSAASLARSDNRLTHLSLSSELFPYEAGRVLPWRMGYGIVHEDGDYKGPPGRPYNGYRPPDAEPVVERRGTLTRGVLWGERRWGRELGLSLETGLRIEIGPAVENGGVLRAAPRFAARYAPSANLSFSAGLGRSYQYTQALSGTAPIVGAGYSANPIWLVAGRGVPAIRADVATIGAETWLGSAWLVTGNAYLRRSTGIALPDPTAGLVVARPPFVTGQNIARGLEFSGRRLAGRWTASASYTLARSTIETAGLSFPASEDRRHALDVTSMIRIGRGLRLGGAFSFASGAPYTRVEQRTVGCSDGRCEHELTLFAPNAHRARTYSSLDLLFDWTKQFRDWDFGVYLQLRNALNHQNDAAIEQSSVECGGQWDPVTGCDGPQAYRDRFQRGLPILPLIGFRARF